MYYDNRDEKDETATKNVSFAGDNFLLSRVISGINDVGRGGAFDLA